MNTRDSVTPERAAVGSSAIVRRREYARGYSAGSRNVPFSWLRHSSSADRGWGAAQARLMQSLNVEVSEPPPKTL